MNVSSVSKVWKNVREMQAQGIKFYIRPTLDSKGNKMIDIYTKEGRSLEIQSDGYPQVICGKGKTLGQAVADLVEQVRNQFLIPGALTNSDKVQRVLDRVDPIPAGGNLFADLFKAVGSRWTKQPPLFKLELSV